jgi:hypothetical protein
MWTDVHGEWAMRRRYGRSVENMVFEYCVISIAIGSVGWAKRGKLKGFSGCVSTSVVGN